MNIHYKHSVSLPLVTLRLRALVSALGEAADPKWWKTEFMNETGLRFLERLYPRTSLRAAVHAAGKAACEAHDKAVGRVRVYHLFRLPETLETEIYGIPSEADWEFAVSFRTALGRHEELLELLFTLGNGAPVGNTAPGAKGIGTDKDIMTTEAFAKTASVYHYAFVQGKPSFPYFSTDRNGER